MAQIAREAGISKALLITTSRVSRTSSSLPPFEALAASLDAFLAWIDQNGTASRKMTDSAAGMPEVRRLIDGIRDATSHEPARDSARARRPRRSSAPPHAPGSGSWTERSSTGWSTGTSPAPSCATALLGSLAGTVTAAGGTDLLSSAASP